MSVKVSLKKLKELRDVINENRPNYLQDKAYITAYGKDIETKQDIYNTKVYADYAQRKGANWSYWLVIGRPRKQGQ